LELSIKMVDQPVVTKNHIHYIIKTAIRSKETILKSYPRKFALVLFQLY